MLVFAQVTIRAASLTVPRAPGVSGAGYSGSGAGKQAASSDTSREVPRLRRFSSAGCPEPGWFLTASPKQSPQRVCQSLVTTGSEPWCL